MVSDMGVSHPTSSGFNSGAAAVGELATSACLKVLLRLLWAWATGTAPLPPTAGQGRDSRCSGPCKPELGPGRANTHGTGSQGQFHHFKVQRLTKQSPGSKANTSHLWKPGGPPLWSAYSPTPEYNLEKHMLKEERGEMKHPELKRCPVKEEMALSNYNWPPWQTLRDTSSGRGWPWQFFLGTWVTTMKETDKSLCLRQLMFSWEAERK